MLLLSPVAGRDPDNGDVTYTEQLLARPPDGVEYVGYPEALRNGTLVEHARRRPGEGTMAALRREGPAMVREAMINQARSQGLLFRERFRHFSVAAGAFDVVHAHVFSVGMRGATRVPLVISNSVRLEELYRDGFGVPTARVDRLRRLDIGLARATGVTHSAYGHAGAARVVCFSEHLRQVFLGEGPAAPERYVVVPPGVDPGPAPTPASRAEPFHLGFIGDWHAKGGDLVLEAHRQLRAEGWPARLTVVGGKPRLGPEESARLQITWLPRLPRGRLLGEVVPSLSAFAYPSRFDGLPLTLLEVMAQGVPVIVSNYGALPEVVAHGRAGIVIEGGNVQRLVAALQGLQDRSARVRLGTAARERVLSSYDISAVGASLASIYVAAHEASSR